MKIIIFILGARVAAQLVGLAGGLIALSKIPACNIQVRQLTNAKQSKVK